jgi:hypothetical protein
VSPSSWHDDTSFIVQVDPKGVVGTTEVSPTALPLGTDGGGDFLFAPIVELGYGDFVRTVGEATDQPGPAPWRQGTWAVDPTGRAIALIWYPDLTNLDLSIWHP